jgi:hypothetical protein
MKKYISIILVLKIILSCTNNQTKESNIKTLETKNAKLPSLFEGEWILYDYIKSIEKTLSPIKSAHKLKGIVTLIIPRTSKNDTIEIGASLNNHEGYSFRIILEQGIEKNSFKTDLTDFENESNRYEIGYKIIDNKEFLFLYRYNQSNKLIAKIKFTKVMVNKPESDLEEGLQQFVNEKIFKGKFLLYDSTNLPIKLTFNSDGKIYGHPNFKTYYVLTDFIGEPVPLVDEIIVNFRTENSKNFVFKAKKDTIFLYTPIGDGEPGGEPLNFGELKYKLIRE